MERYSIEFNDYEPKYIQIADNIKRLINSNVIKDGDKLPPIRSLAKELKVNNVTIVSCYNKLVSEGYAYQKMYQEHMLRREKLLIILEKSTLRKLS